jgi:hypothetical protein
MELEERTNETDRIRLGTQRQYFERITWLDRQVVDAVSQLQALQSDVGPLFEQVRKIKNELFILLPVTWVYDGKKEKGGPRGRRVLLCDAVMALYEYLGIEMKLFDNSSSEYYTCYKPRRKR